MKIFTLILLLIIGLSFACNNSGINVNEKSQNQIDRENTFLELQGFIDKKYPNWKVKGLRKEKTEIDENVNDRTTYLLLITDGKTEKTVFVIKADFEDVDGNIQTSFFEPSAEDIKRLEKSPDESDFSNYESGADDPRN